MKTSLRSLLVATLLVSGLAAVSAHAGPGLDYWKSRAEARKVSANAAKVAEQPAQPAGESCSGSCCVAKKGS